MRRRIFSLMLALAGVAALSGCATERRSVVVGNYKVVYGQMGPAAQRWETIKAAVSGWEVVASADDDDGSVLVLHKPK